MEDKLREILILHGMYGIENVNEAMQEILFLFNVVGQSEQLKAYAEFLYKTPAFQNYSNKDLAIDYCNSL